MNESELEQTISNRLAQIDSVSPAVTQPWDKGLVEFLGVSVLVFCVLVLCIAAYMLRSKQTVDGLVVIKIFGLTLIVCLSAFLMIVGYGQSQLTPVVGLFGAIAGYLLGKERN